MPELTLRLNLEAEDVELVLDGQVVDTVGTEVVASWVEALNEKNPPSAVQEVKPKEEDKPEETQEETPEEVTEETS